KAAPSEVLRMETMKESAKELGKSSGAGLGAGMVLIPQMMQQPAGGAAAVPLVICPNCSAQVPSNSKFCPECGGKLAIKPKTIKCPKCGEAVPAGTKFCPSCGKKLSK
ncbi:MAG: zinc-ribbon domain-containing protein, partial [Candidatus Hadarchaeota archaeon]